MTVLEREGSPYWQIKLTYRKQTRRETSGVLIGTTAAAKKRSFAKAEEIERRWRKEIDEELDGNWTRGTLGQALEKHLKTTIMHGPKVEAAESAARRTRSCWRSNRSRASCPRWR